MEKDFSKVVSSEVEDILQGDVPYFYSYIDSNKIKNSKDENTDIFLDESPLDKVLMKINNLSGKDKERQLYFIHMSFLAKTTNSHKDETNTLFSNNIVDNTINNNELRELAVQIGDYIIDKSISGYSENRLDRTWISTILIGRDECNWSLAPVGNSLYDGNSGIALFLGHLNKVTGKNRFIQAASEAIEGVIHEIEVLDTKYPFLIGPYNGISGYLYSIYQIYKITEEPRFLNVIKEKIHLLYELIPKDKNIDVISGVSGTIGVLLSIYNDSNDEDLKEKLLHACKLCFKHIKESKIEFFGDSIAWGSGGIYVPCTGFAHGNAGIISYLIKLYKIVKDEDILDIIKKALNYERHFYAHEHKNWYSSEENKHVSLAWCHGAPGILLSRLILKESGYNDDYIDHEIKIALETTMEQGFGNNPSFCHGDLGNLSIVEYAAKVLKDKDLLNRCTNTFNFMFNNVLKDRWGNGVFSGTESMGLMIGLASFGYGLLREIDKSSVPEILWF
ncbi:Nisin biosynthesis protein NisC [Clostridium vincentii]|uniref:Nisin biosynthesis protein NisC n=1 Tax=Clostridium vincentii TaxID=52704 RepID=A0A2T0BH39_9CLOT|nr:Nisin biosynthesis protein NisC [Clostridium vincentii]